MKQILCDTDVLIDFFDNNKSRHSFVKEQLKKFDQEKTEVLVSIVSKMELVQGAKSKTEVQSILSKSNKYSSIPITSPISENALDLIIQFSKSHNLKISDALIAATALILNIYLFTFNHKHFKYIPGIKLYES